MDRAVCEGATVTAVIAQGNSTVTHNSTTVHGSMEWTVIVKHGKGKRSERPPPTSMGTGGLLLRSTATVHRRASALNSFEAGPTAALPVDAGGQEQGCPARVEPHGREAVRLLHLPDAFQPPERRCPARANPHRQEAPQMLVLRQDVRADSPQHSTAPPHSTTTANERACFFLFLVLKTFSGTQTVRSHASCGSATEKTTLRHPDPTAS